MKPTERYAAVALLLLVALVIVVGFWDTGQPNQEPFDEAALASSRAARLEESARPASGRRTVNEDAQRAGSASVPLAGSISDAPRVDKVTTRRISTAGHRVAPGGGRQGGASTTGGTTVRVEKHSQVAQSADQLANTLRPGKRGDGAILDFTAENAAGTERSAAQKPAQPGPFFSRKEPQAHRQPSGGTRADRLTEKTSVEVATVRKKQAAEHKKAVSDPTLQSYKVKSGDALIRIAKHQCGSEQAVADIVRLNGLVDSDIIFVGMVLKLPSRASVEAKIASSAKASAAASTSESTSGRAPSGSTKPVAVAASSKGSESRSGPAGVAGRRTVRIQSGEVLGVVLERECGTYVRSIALVRELNPGLDPNNVQVGQKILLPARAEVPKSKGARKPSRAIPSTSARTAGTPRLAANTAPEPRKGRNSNKNFVVR